MMQPRPENAASARERIDRVSLLFDRRRRKRRAIVTPEGVLLDVEIADHAERLAAFLIDMGFWLIATVLLYTAAFFLLAGGLKITVATTIVLFIAFLVRTSYFIQFELAWRGSTPGKRICGLKVIDRAGGALTASSIVARNLTREVEVFLPLGLFFLVIGGGSQAGWREFATLIWVGAILCLPFFNRDRLRGGDFIAGTMVIAMPKRVLADDLSQTTDTNAANETNDFVFTAHHLQSYGAYELQVLEELLRQPRSNETRRLYGEIAIKIARRIGWTQEMAPAQSEQFLRAFYTAERAELEREQLFGRLRDDKDGRVAS